MTTTKHTPGPWTLGNENNAGAEVCAGEVTISLDRHDRSGAVVISREEMLANAHLVIAAPELLDACRAACSMLGALREDSRIAQYIMLESTYGRVMLACAKAEKP